MKHSYFRSDQSDQFSFYRIPKVLFTDEQYKSISTDAKVLYGLLLDRMSLSQKNGWCDSEGRVFIVFTVEEITTALGCASQKAVKLLTELETSAELIERKRQGLGKPNLIYVLNFSDSSESQFQNGENHNSGMMKIKTPEFPKSQCNNTDSNNTELSDTDSVLFTSFKDADARRTDVKLRNEYIADVPKNIKIYLYIAVQDFR